MGTTREASKVTTVFETVSVCGARVPVPLVAKAPEAPPTAQSVVLNWPVILRVSSLCHAPASSMLPPVQLRKGEGAGQKSSKNAKIDDYRELYMCRSELSSIMLIPDTSRVESHVKRLEHKLCTCIICEFMSLRGYRIDCAVHLDCRYQCDIPAYRPRAGDMPSRIRDSPTSLSRPSRPSSERRGADGKDL